MFFKLEEWSYKKVKMMSLIFNGIYYLIALGIPVALICVNFDLFKHVEQRVIEAYDRPTIWLIICVLIILVVGVRQLLRTLDEFPEATRTERIFKFGLKMVFALVIPCFMLWVVATFKIKFDAACNLAVTKGVEYVKDFMLQFDKICKTAITCLGCWIGGIVVDHLFVKHIDVQKRFYKEAEESTQIDKCKENLKK